MLKVGALYAGTQAVGAGALLRRGGGSSSSSSSGCGCLGACGSDDCF